MRYAVFHLIIICGFKHDICKYFESPVPLWLSVASTFLILIRNSLFVFETVALLLSGLVIEFLIRLNAHYAEKTAFSFWFTFFYFLSIYLTG